MENYPYKPTHLIENVEPPIDTPTPETSSKVIETARHIFTTGELPQQFEQLEGFFEELYSTSYEEERSFDVEPFDIDLLFQQYAIKRDEVLGRNGFNTFGLYALSYLDGLATNTDKAKRFLREKPGDDHQPTALLLGCSSITTAVQFNEFVKAINPKARAVIADIDSTACQLAKESETEVVQLDAQKIALPEMTVDFIATNFLIFHLRDRLNAGQDTLANIMLESARILTRSGRIVMVEQLLSRSDEEWLNHFATQADLAFAKGVSLLNRDAIILPTHRDFRWAKGDIPQMIKKNLNYGTKPSELYSKAQQLKSVSAFTFEESKWSARKGWKKVGKPVIVRSNRAGIG